jgi:hypothetical protein
MAEEEGSGDHGAHRFTPLPLSLSVIMWLLAAHREFLVTASSALPRPAAPAAPDRTGPDRTGPDRTGPDRTALGTLRGYGIVATARQGVVTAGGE